MKKTTILIAGALLLGAFAANAQTPTTPRKPFGTGELPEFLKPYDLDGDGKLSVEERQAFEKAMREAKPKRPGIKNPWDTDGDGKLSEEEIQAARAAIEAKMTEMRTKRFNELDTDDDGFLTAAELKAIPRTTDEMVARMIGHLDKADAEGNKDGKISLEEFLAVLKPVQPPIPPMPPLPRLFPAFCPPLLAAFDTSKDGKLSADEVAAMMTALDTNKDGRISFDEWKAYVLANPGLLPPPPNGDDGSGHGGAR